MQKKTNVLVCLLKLSKQNVNDCKIINENIFYNQERIDNKKMDIEIIDYQKEKLFDMKHSEQELIKDLIFVFQGIDGQYLQFQKKDKQFKIKQIFSLPVIELVEKLSEIGLFFKCIQEFINQSEQSLTEQAFKQVIKDELNEYYKILAILQNRTDLNLRKLFLWVQDPLETLKWILILIQSQKNLKGSQIISAIYAYINCGNSTIQSLILRILSQIIQPLIRYITNWIYYGELQDKYSEFFIEENLNYQDWEKQYKVVENRIPSFLNLNQAKQIMISGKTVNFLQKACNIRDFQIKGYLNFLIEKPNFHNIINENFTQGIKILNNHLDEMSKNINEKLVNVLIDRFKIKQHFQNIKKYILGSQGDFTQNLIEILNHYLLQNGNLIYKHNVISMIHSVLRPRQFHEISEFIDVKLLQYQQGDSGWDIFSLNYNCPPPINTVINQASIQNYLRISNFLWKVKRVEYNLEKTWLKQQETRRDIQSQQDFPLLMAAIKRSFLLKNEMMHFIKNLSIFISIEVIESSWKEFFDQFEQAQSLDQIILLHNEFLNKILQQTMLNQQLIYDALKNILDTFYLFKDRQDQLYELLQDFKDYFKDQEQKQQIQNIAYGVQSQFYIEINQDQETKQNEIIRLFDDVYFQYNTTLNRLMDILKKENYKDNLRFFVFKIDFNDYYANKQNESLVMESGQQYGLSINTNYNQQEKIQNNQPTDSKKRKIFVAQNYNQQINYEFNQQNNQYNNQQNNQYNNQNNLNIQQNIQQQNNQNIQQQNNQNIQNNQYNIQILNQQNINQNTPLNQNLIQQNDQSQQQKKNQDSQNQLKLSDLNDSQEYAKIKFQHLDDESSDDQNDIQIDDSDSDD